MLTAICRSQRYFSSNISHKIKIGLYAGSFDPPSEGHLDIIERALSICDKLIVGVGINALKKPIFSFEERKDLIEQITKDHEENIEIKMMEGLVADFVIDNNVDF